MGRHATSFNVIWDTIAAWLTLAVAFVRLSWRVTAGRHAWRPLPEVACGASPAWGQTLHGWNNDPATVAFEPVIVWPVVDLDQEAVTHG